MGPLRQKLTNLDPVFCKKWIFIWIRGKTFFPGLKFAFLGVKSGHFYGLCHFAGIEGCLPELRAEVKEL